jgi:hypothetical protein
MNTTPHTLPHIADRTLGPAQRFYAPSDRTLGPAQRFFAPSDRTLDPAQRFFDPAQRFFDPATAGPMARAGTLRLT